MSCRVLLNVAVLLTSLHAPPVVAEEKSAAKPGDSRRDALVQAGYTPVPFTLDPRSWLIFVDGSVGPEKVKFLLDSGSQVTELDLKLAKRLNLKLAEEVVSTVQGGKRAKRWTEFPGLMIGPYDTSKDWNHLEGMASDLSGLISPTGLLGGDVLDTWAAVIDYPARTMYLRPSLLTAWPRLAGTWAVTSWQEDGAARKLDPKTPPTLAFADRRLKLTDGGQTREYAIRLVPKGGVELVSLFDPKQEGKPDPVTLAGGLIKVAGGEMTACLALNTPKVIPTTFAAPKGSGCVLLELKRTSLEAQKPPTDKFRELLLKDGYTAVRLDRDSGGWRTAAAHVDRHDIRLIVDTGAAVSAFDTAGLSNWGAKRLGEVQTQGLGGKVEGEKISLRGLSFGGYDTRRSWSELYGQGFDMAGLNKALAEWKLPPLQGLLGNLDLLTGSAVIDFGTNTLYLRPVKETIGPQLEGKWAGVKYEFDGLRGRYAPGDGTVDFKGGRVRFTTRDGTKEWGFHLRDEGDRYRLGLFDPGTDELADGFKYSSVGLLRLDGTTLTLVMEHGQNTKEPTDFAAPKGSGLLLIEYEQAK